MSTHQIRSVFSVENRVILLIMLFRSLVSLIVFKLDQAQNDSKSESVYSNVILCIFLWSSCTICFMIINSRLFGTWISITAKYHTFHPLSKLPIILLLVHFP